MVLKAPLKTDFLGITYPDENCDPFYDQYVQGVLQSEIIMFYSKIFSNMWLADGGTRSWSPSLNLLTWTSDFTVLIPHWGRKISIVYGPDSSTRQAGLADGQMLVITVPMGLAANITANFQVLSQLDVNRHDQFVCGARIGSKLYLKGLGEF